MKIIITVIAAVLLAAGIRSINPEVTGGSASADTTFQNPNGTSELAMLMRDMQKYANDAKAALKAGTKPAPFPEAFKKIYTAEITEGMSKSDFYTQFADLYITAVKNYSTSTAELRVDAYNNMVNSCLACHSQHCPGPVPVIRKMIWDPGKN